MRGGANRRGVAGSPVFGGLIGVVTCLAFIGCPLNPATAAAAAAGRLDTTFGDGGLVETQFGPSFLGSSFTSVKPEPGDGVLLWREGPELQNGYWRYRPGGTLELEANSPEVPPLRAVAADGKSVEVVWLPSPSSVGRSEFEIRRTQPDGEPDPSFGTGGQEALPFFTQDPPASFALEPHPQLLIPLVSGKLVIGGTVVFHKEEGPKAPSPEIEVVLLRLDADGQPDTTFGGDGVVRLRTDLGVADPRLSGLGPRQGEGLIVGVDRGGGGSLVGLTAAGALDATFGSAGTEPVAGAIAGVHTTGDGKALVAGTEPSDGAEGWWGADFFVSRFDVNGHPDPDFGTARGTTSIDFGGDETASSVLWEEGGSVLIGGGSVDATAPCTKLGLCRGTPVLARIAADGRPDAGFSIALSRLSNGSPNRRAGPACWRSRPGRGAGYTRPGGQGRSLSSPRSTRPARRWPPSGKTGSSAAATRGAAG